MHWTKIQQPVSSPEFKIFFARRVAVEVKLKIFKIYNENP